MNINGYNPYKKGFDMLVADIQEHEARCVTPSRCEPFSTKLSADGVNRLGDTIADLRMEVARLRVIEDAAVACSEHPVWNDDQFYGLMTELQRALRGEVGDDKTANVELRGRAAGEGPVERSGTNLSAGLGGADIGDSK